MLGKLLAASGEKAYLLRHGTDRSARHLILIRHSDKEAKALATATGVEPEAARVAGFRFIALPLEAGAKIGSVDEKLYDPSKGQWTATIAVMRFR